MAKKKLTIDPNPAAAAAEEEQEEGYEDLYDDVNIGFFELPAEECSQKDVFGASNCSALGIHEGEVSIAHMKGLSVGSALFANQENEILSTIMTETQVSNVSMVNIKAEGSIIAVKASEVSATTQPQVTVTLETKAKVGAPALVISINQARSKEETAEETMGIHFQSTTTAQASELTPTTQLRPTPTYPTQDRGLSKVNGMEAPPGLGLVVNEDYERTGLPIKSGKPFDNDDGRHRMPMETANRAYAGDSKVSQGGGFMESVATAGVNDYTAKHNGQQLYGGGNNHTMLFVGELHWWTTDAELETALSEYGAVKSLKFNEERASGKSKGFCQVEMHDPAAAYACKEGMNGHKFHGRPCVVAYANPRTILQMGNAQVEKTQAQVRSQQAHVQPRRTMNDFSGITRGTNSYQGGENTTRGYGRSSSTGTGTGRGSHGQAVTGRGSGRGRPTMGSKGLAGNGGTVRGVVPYGQGLVGPMGSHPSGMMMPQAMMGQGYDPSYGPPRGGSGYGGYVLPGPPFTGMVQPFPTVGPGSLPGVAPHVNPAFFARNSSANGMGLMGMDGSQNPMWGDGNMNGWAGDEHDRRGREASYDDEAADSDYTYSNELAYEKSRGAEELNRADMDGLERRRHRVREGSREQRDRERDGEKDEWERERSWRTKNKGRSGVEEEDKDQRIRSREEDYGKKRRSG